VTLRKPLLAALLAAAAFVAQAQDAVVYHIDNAAVQALKGLRNIRNHIDVDPAAKITVVTHADGVDGVFRASEVLARHDETYMPPEVADALKRAGHWQPEQGAPPPPSTWNTLNPDQSRPPPPPGRTGS